MRIFTIAIMAILSCNDAATTEKTTAATTPAATGDTTTMSSGQNQNKECYMQVLQRDTFVAVLTIRDNIISGKLTFDNFEKDGSSGTVTGTADNGIFKLWYNFHSEGMQSVMQVWFKKQDNLLFRGVGEMSTKGDTSYFVNEAAIGYNETLNLRKTSCESVPAKYQ